MTKIELQYNRNCIIRRKRERERGEGERHTGLKLQIFSTLEQMAMIFFRADWQHFAYPSKVFSLSYMRLHVNGSTEPHLERDSSRADGETIWRIRIFAPATLVCAPSTRCIKSAAPLPRHVDSSTGMKYRFSIGHSLTLGRFRIKLPGLGVRSGSLSFNPYRFQRYTSGDLRSLMAIGTFVTYLEKRVVIPTGTLWSEPRKIAGRFGLFIHPLPFLRPLRCIHLGKALMRPGRSMLYPRRSFQIASTLIGKVFGCSVVLFETALLFFFSFLVTKIEDLCLMDSTQWAHAFIRSHRRWPANSRRARSVLRAHRCVHDARLLQNTTEYPSVGVKSASQKASR